MTRLTRNEVKFEWNYLCEEGIPRIEDEAYFSSYFDSPEKGIKVHNVL